jgi:hypothetical protein
MRLPVAVAQDAHPRLNFKEPFFGLGQPIRPSPEVSGNGLGIASEQKTARHKIIGNARGVGRMGDEFRTVHEYAQGWLHPYNECISSAWDG